jgi:hypothetical protein
MSSPTTSTPRRRKAIRRQRRRKADNVYRLQGIRHDSGWNSNRSLTMSSSQRVYEIRPRKDRRGFDLISDRLPLGLLWFEGPAAFDDAVSYAKFFSRSHPVIIRVFDQSGAVIETHEHAGQFQRVDEKRYCLVCGKIITGWEIQVIGGTRENGPRRIICPTERCNAMPIDWVEPTDEFSSP